MLKRIVLFALTNVAVLLVLGVLLRVLGLDHVTYGRHGEIPWWSLLASAAVIGSVGSIVSLLMSKQMALWSTGARIVQSPRSDAEAWLLGVVREQAQRAGIGVPDVAVYDSADPNAFATGARRDHALVAVSTGLLRTLSREETEAVLAHEISHVANGDMITMALIQGVVNTFVIFFSRVVGILVDSFLRREDDRRGPGLGGWLASLVAQVVFGILASMLVAWFSRRREFRADAGAASLRGAPSMIAALQRLRAMQSPSGLPASMAAFGIRGGEEGFLALFATHPPLEARIAALRAHRA